MFYRRNPKAKRPTTFKLNPAAFPAVYATTRLPSVEPLEQRVLLSVSYSTLLGPLTVGHETDYETLSNGTETGTDVNEVVANGTASFNGTNGLTEIQDNTTPVPANGTTVDQSEEYLQTGSTGATVYGNTSSLVSLIGTQNETDTFSPAYTSLPATLVAGTVYTATYTSTAVSTGITTGTSTIDFTFTVELTSDTKQSITVPGGTFSAYLVHVTLQASENGTTEPPSEITEYDAPGVGNVETMNVISETYEGNTINSTAISELTGTGTGVVTGTAAQVAFTGGPAALTTGVVSSTPFAVTVEDSSGSPVTGDTSDVTVALTSPNGATLGGTLTEPAIGGIATFSDLTINQTGTYTLTATDSSLTSAVSPAIVVSAASNPTFATLTDGALVVNGTSGDDIISLTTSGSTLIATLNGVSSSFTASAVTSIDVEGGAGDDTITLGAGIIGASVQGGPGNDSIVGGPGNDTLGGGQGNDTILGDGGDDLIHGGAGDDSIGGGQGNDNLYGGLGNDTMTGGAGDDLLTGGAGNNLLHGGLGDDIFFAINGIADTLYGGAGNNTAHIDQGLDQIPNSDIQTILFT